MSDQRVFKVVDQRWNNIDSTLKMKQNPTLVFQRCKTLIQRPTLKLKQRRNNLAQRWKNVETTLHNVSTLFQRSLNVVETLSKPIGLLNMDL